MWALKGSLGPPGVRGPLFSAADVEDLASKTAVTLEAIPDTKKEEDFPLKGLYLEHSFDS